MKNVVCSSLFAILLPTLSYAAEQQNHAEHTQDKHAKAHQATSGVEAMSASLRDLLTQEMSALQYGMMSIIPAYVAGNWGEIETSAGKMKNSYILKQKLTEQQIEEFHSSLPAEFIKQDQNFHYLAGMLEHAAKSGKPELINFYFSEMNRACVSCHTDFATHKFPALKAKKSSEHAH